MTDRQNFAVVMVTASSHDEAEKIAASVVEKRLAACVNIVGRVESVFRWEGKIERATEVLLILKTTRALFERLSREIKRLHSYEVPEIILLDVKRGENKYLRWLRSSVAGILIFFAAASVSIAQSQSKSYKVCVIKSQDIEPYAAAIGGFESALKDAGYVSGENLLISYYDMKQDWQEGITLTEEIKNQNPDLILALGVEAAGVAKEKVQKIPIVFSVVQEPLAKGLVKSLSAPGSNITGSTIDVPLDVQLKALRLFFPNLQRVGLIYNPRISQPKVTEAQAVAENLGIQLVLEQVSSYKEVPEALRDMLGRIDAMWLLSDPTVITRQSLEYIFVRTLWSKKAVMGFSSYIVSAGALFALGFDYYDIGRQSGELAAKILSGQDPGRMPVTVPRKTHLIINMKTARHLELEVPPAVLKQAEELVQ